MSKNSAFGLAALLATRDPIGFALLSDISSSWPGSSGVLEEVTFLTSGSFDPTVYPDALAFFVECWAGGGSGNAAKTVNHTYNPPSGGGGGEYNSGLLLASDLGSTPILVTIGAGGASVSNTVTGNAGESNVPGNDGGDTSFGDYIIATGGSGGQSGIDISGPVFTTGGVFIKRLGFQRVVCFYSLGQAGMGFVNKYYGKPWSVVRGDGGYGGSAGSSGGIVTGVVGFDTNSQAIPLGGDSEWGGAGGGGASYSSPPAGYTNIPGGTSQYSGNGGFGVVAGNATKIAGSGLFPSGGGGSGNLSISDGNTYTVTSGAGGSGQVKVSVIYA
jgi:hypothetical protein